MLISPAMGFEAVCLLLTAGINHPRAVPLWGRARLVSFAVAARQEDFPGWGRICFTFILCFWRLLLNQTPLDVVISKCFTAAACEAGGEGKGRGAFEAGMFPSGPGIPVEFSEMRGQVVRPRWEDTGLLNAEFRLLFLGQKRFVCSVRVLA